MSTNTGDDFRAAFSDVAALVLAEHTDPEAYRVMYAQMFGGDAEELRASFAAAVGLLSCILTSEARRTDYYEPHPVARYLVQASRYAQKHSAGNLGSEQ